MNRFAGIVTPFGNVRSDGTTPMPKSWTERVDRDYEAFLAGKRKRYGIKCRFTLPDGTVFDTPCRMIKGKLFGIEHRGRDGFFYEKVG